MGKQIHRRQKRIAILSLVLIIVLLLGWYLSRHTIAVLQPAGQIGQKERGLMMIAGLLSAIVVIPVYAMTVIIVWKYRVGNKNKSRYEPDWDHSRLYESIWWGIPLVIITILSVITWYSSHALDPFKSLASAQKPLTIQVVALDWKWLFIYPDQHVASVNLVELPENTPIDFNITSDTVMNSFWIPQLGGQIYAMPGMSTHLHLIANRMGSFAGSSANISGQGFADMTFTAKSVTKADFSQWLKAVTKSHQKLSLDTYASLARPTLGSPVRYYANVTAGLYDYTVMKYMAPITADAGMSSAAPLNSSGVYSP